MLPCRHIKYIAPKLEYHCNRIVVQNEFVFLWKRCHRDEDWRAKHPHHKNQPDYSLKIAEKQIARRIYITNTYRQEIERREANYKIRHYGRPLRHLAIEHHHSEEDG